MRKYKEVLRKEIADVVCDICKKSCIKCFDDVGFAEYATIEARWGYCSKKDGEKFESEICEDCFDKLIDFIESLKKDVSTN